MLRLIRRKSQAFRKKLTDNYTETEGDIYPSQPRNADTYGRTFDPISEDTGDNDDE
jgi:hypothetical protein